VPRRRRLKSRRRTERADHWRECAAFAPAGAGGTAGLVVVGHQRADTDAVANAWLRLSANPAKGDGGTGYGDSGGPNVPGESDVIARLTVTGDAVCRATNVIYRLKTPSARGS
jgi:hypothetical protein